MGQFLNNNLPLVWTALTGLLLVSTVWIIFKLLKLERVRKEFYSSNIKKDLEQVLVDQNRSITKINDTLDKHNSRITDLAILNQDNIKKIGFVKFNHIDGSGGNLSFALSLLDEHGDGMVITSLHGREGVRVYGKQIKNKKSETKLTQEEIQAIQEAN